MQCLFLKGKLKTKQNPIILGGGYWVYTLRDVLGLLVMAKGTSTTWATWLNTVHGTTAQKTAAQHPGRFWMSHYFDDSHWLLMNLDLKLVSLEAPWNYLSIHIKNVQNGHRMRPGRHFWCRLLLYSEVDSNLSCFGPPPWGLEPDNFGPSTWLGKPCRSPSSLCHSPCLAICILVMSSSPSFGVIYLLHRNYL